MIRFIFTMILFISTSLLVGCMKLKASNANIKEDTEYEILVRNAVKDEFLTVNNEVISNNVIYLLKKIINTPPMIDR